MSKINWQVRFKNKAFWVALIPALLVLIQVILKLFGIEWNTTELQGQLLDIVNALFVVLSILGIVTDPTTEGVTDSASALEYTEPKKD